MNLRQRELRLNHELQGHNVYLSHVMPEALLIPNSLGLATWKGSFSKYMNND